MGDVVEFKLPKEEKAVTCGCGNQEFILVNDGRQVFCPQCEHILSKLRFEWVME